MTNFFLQIYKFLLFRKLLRMVLLIVSFSLIAFFASKISLQEDIAGFMPKDKNSERVNFVYKNISISEKIIVRISAKNISNHIDKENLIEASEIFASYLDSLTKDKGYIKEIFYKIDQQKLFDITNFLTQNAIYYLTEKDYAHIDSLLTSGNIKTTLENNKKILVSPAGIVLKNNIISDPLHISSGILSRLKDFKLNNQYENYNDYIFSKKGNNLLLFITTANNASETARNKELVNCINNSINYLQQIKGSQINVNYFGAAPVAVSNAERIKTDSYISIIIAIVLILIILFWFFKDIKTIFLIAVPVVFGGLLALAALYFIKGSISAIAIGAGSVIFGIAINYSLHFLIHTKHENNIEQSIKEIASPMVVGSTTTVGAFLSLLFISADSMRDFGLFAAFSLIGTLLFVLIFLPHFCSKKTDKHKEESKWLGKLSDYRFEKNKYILLFVLVLTIIFSIFSPKVSFDSDMSKLNYMTADQRKSFKELSDFTTIGEKSIYLISDGKDINQALQKYEITKPTVDSLIQNKSITGFAGIGAFMPSDSMQQAQINKWNNFWATRKDKVKKLLVEQGKTVGFKENSFDSFFQQLDKQYTVQPLPYFSIVTDNFLKDYLIIQNNRAMVISLLYTNPQKTENVERKLTNEHSFVFDSSSISRSLINSLSNDFNTVLYICAILVFVFLTISFGRLELSFISFLPMFISWLWILGIMAIFNINFNIVNIILSAFIFGLGDDFTIFMIDGMMNEYAYKRRLLSSYKIAVGLSAVTMFIGIGTLVFAQHPAMRSLGNVTIIGMVSVVIISFIIPPLLYNYLTYKKGYKRLIPITLMGIFVTIFCFICFIIGCIALTLTGFFLLTISKPSEKNKSKYHLAIVKVCRFIVKNIPYVKSELINKYGETFDKPAIIICNHQSHIDLIYLMMLSPKIVILTNEWVWKSPFYGQLIRYADFYPVANGIENSIDRLSTLVDRGYSIAIFPEGTRSEDCSILRFHRGAFYLAEKLKLDIIPIVVHGIGHALPKKELLLRKGKVTLNILKRISADDTSFGNTYAERSKQFRQLYITEYKHLAEKEETPAYFSNLVFHNYIYKGYNFEKQARKQLKKYHDFVEIISLLPSCGKVLIVNSNIGILALMASLVKKEVEFTAIDENLENVDIGTNCASKPYNLTFKQASVKDIELDEYNYVVLIDPTDIESVETCVHKYQNLILINKNKPYYKDIIEKEGCNIIDNGKNAIISIKKYHE
jgi:uncharacterized protein